MEENNVESGVTLGELIKVLFRNIYLIIGVTVAVTIMGVIYTFKFVEPTYVSDADIMVQVDAGRFTSGQASDYDLTSTLRITQTIAEFLEKDIVLDAVIEELNLDMTPGQIRKGLKVTYSSQSLFVNVQFEGNDPEIAKRIVDSLISNAKEIAETKFSILKDTFEDLGEAKDARYASPNKPLNVIISILLGAVLGVVGALLLEAFKTTIRNKKELENLNTGYQIIGVIPQIKDAKGV